MLVVRPARGVVSARARASLASALAAARSLARPTRRGARRGVRSGPLALGSARRRGDGAISGVPGVARVPAVDLWVSIAANFRAKRRRYARA
jgi:hypothetical protein